MNFSEEYKDHYWKAFERQRSGWYNNVASKTKGLLEEEAKGIEGVYLTQGRTGVERYLSDRTRVWGRVLKALYVGIIEEFGRQTYDSLIEKKEFDPFSSFINEWSDEWSATRAVLITDTSKILANRAITSGLEAGQSVDEIGGKLRTYYDESANYRSMRMSRTEVVGASNYGSFEGAKQTGVVKTKTWVSSRDERVRDSHVSIDGETVPIDQPYSNGMMYPGDPNGSSTEVIHCRCTQAYGTEELPSRAVVEPEEEKLDLDPQALEEVQSFRNSTKDNDFETLIVIDDKRNVTYRKLGGASSVEVPNADLAKLKNNIVVHNHPAESSFSKKDMELASKANVENMVVTTNKHIFSIKPEEGAKWPEGGSFWDYQDNHKEALFDKIWSSEQIHDFSFNLSNQMVEGWAKENNLKYIVMKI